MHNRVFRISVAVSLIACVTVFSFPSKVFAGKTLNVKFDRQDRPLSCEVAALKMALAYKKVKVSETQLMQIVGYDKTPKRNGVWGNPNKGFVGNIDGWQNGTGYGVHWYPIRRAARKFRPADTYSWMTVQDLTRQIDKGNPVIIWGTFRSSTAKYDPWRTPDGILIKAWRGEHTRVVVGYRGTAKNPRLFILMDPITGRTVWTTAQLKANWGRFINSGVVVR